MFDPVPIIWFKPVDDFKVEPDEYLAPLYKASSREGKLSTTGASTNFVLHVTMPTKAAPSHWTLRAAALLCMLDD
jgi:dynein heavy chain